MESFVRDASNRTYRILCKCHLLYDSAFLINHFDAITRQAEEDERSKIEFENVANLNRERPQQQSRRRKRGSRFRWKLAFISHFLLFRILYHTAIWILDSQISDRLHVLLLNPFAFEHFDSNMQFFFILNLVLAHDMLHLIYARNRGLTFRVLREAIVENGNSFFLESRFRFSNRIVRFLAGPDDLISKQLLSFGIWISNASSKIFYFFYLHQINLAIRQLATNHWFAPLDYVILGLSFALNLLMIYLFSHVALIMAVYGILVTKIGYVKLAQTEHFVHRNFVHHQHHHRRSQSMNDSITFGQRFPANKFKLFRAAIVSLIHYLGDANRVYGKAFFHVILTNVPLNSMLFAMLLTERFRFPIRLMVIGIIAVQLFVLIVLHISAAVLSRRLHQPVGHFFRFIADPDLRVRRRGSISRHEPKQAIELWRHITMLKPKVLQTDDNNKQKLNKITKIKKN